MKLKVRTNIGTEYHSKAVIITTGTFLRGEIILGNMKYSSGPNHQLPSITLSDNLRELGFDIVRFKTVHHHVLIRRRLITRRLKFNQVMM